MPVPEMPEVEAYRRLAEQRALRRRIASVDASDGWFRKRGVTEEELVDALVGARFTETGRIGKLLLVTVDSGHVLGLRFGMTGRLLVDGHDAVGRLLYTSAREFEAWDRFIVRFTDGGDLRIRDPRRLGGVELDPDVSRLGVDVLDLTFARLRDALGESAAPLKARLMDQARIAGIGNLMADEALWRAGLHPARAARSLSTAELRRLHTHLRRTVTDLLERGGSHEGDVIAHRSAGGCCPRDGAPLSRTTVGGRTSYWCPKHQH